MTESTLNYAAHGYCHGHHQSEIAAESRIAALERLVAQGFDASTHREIVENIERTAAANLLATGDAKADIETLVLKGHGELNTQGALNAAQIGVALEKGFGELNTQNALNSAAIGVQIEKTAAAAIVGQKDALIDAGRHYGEIQLTAMTNSKELQRDLLQTKYDLEKTVRMDGESTRALVTSQYEANLQRELAVAQNRISELEHHNHNDRRARETEVNVAQTVNQNQAQFQQQQQQQQQLQLMERMCATMGNLCNDIQYVRQAQSNVNFGFQGTGGQVASGTNVR